MLLLVSVAAATTTVDSGFRCFDEAVLGVRPADGSVVPPSVAIALRVKDGCVAFPVLRDATGDAVDGDHTFPSAELAIFTPARPLAPGAYQVTTSVRGDPVPWSTFTVDAGATPPPPPPEPTLAVRAERTCGAALFTTAEVEVAFPADPEGWALVDVHVRTENGEVASVTDLWAGQDLVVVHEEVLGGREVCATATLRGWDGEVTGTTPEVCAAPFEGCPADARDPAAGDTGGCGCRATAQAGGLPLGLLALAGVRRRRRGSRDRR